MDSDLIVMTFPGVGGGERARRTTGILRDRQTLGLDYMTVVTKVGTQPPVIHHRQSLPIYPQKPEQILLELLADGLFVHAKEERAIDLVEAGIDRRFVERVADATTRDSSALVIYVPYDSMADVEQLVGVLTLLEGTVHRTTLPTQVQRALLRAGREE